LAYGNKYGLVTSKSHGTAFLLEKSYYFIFTAAYLYKFPEGIFSFKKFFPDFDPYYGYGRGIFNFRGREISSRRYFITSCFQVIFVGCPYRYVGIGLLIAIADFRGRGGYVGNTDQGRPVREFFFESLSLVVGNGSIDFRFFTSPPDL